MTASQYGDVEEFISPGLTVKELLRSFFGFRHDFLGPVAAAIVGFVIVFIFTFGIASQVI